MPGQSTCARLNYVEHLAFGNNPTPFMRNICTFFLQATQYLISAWVANEILENEPENCWTVAFIVDFRV